jgi:hypothetical protein
LDELASIKEATSSLVARIEALYDNLQRLLQQPERDNPTSAAI